MESVKKESIDYIKIKIKLESNSSGIKYCFTSTSTGINIPWIKKNVKQADKK
jgi:hypothetical protein